MELGNIFFGHSRGEFSMDRDSGWEEELWHLFHRIDPDEDVPEFENDTFAVRPYWWGDCVCGWENFYGDRNDAWHKENSHGPDCYQTKVDEELFSVGWRRDGWGVMSPPCDDYKKRGKEQDAIRKRWCRRLGLTYPDGCAVHCTCDYNTKHKEFVSSLIKEFGGGEEGHKETCPIVLPNFLHKPTGFSIRWYKYPLRDSYKNMDIGLKDFMAIIDDCEKSLDTARATGV